MSEGTSGIGKSISKLKNLQSLTLYLRYKKIKELNFNVMINWFKLNLN